MTKQQIEPANWMCDAAAKRLFAVFGAAGHELRFVGGCVRDAVLGLPPTDIDLATTMLPNVMLAVLKRAGIRALPTGLDHGTVTALVDGSRYEITTLRADVTTDGRHATVAFSTSWEADAARRDFTINGMNVNADGVLEDLVGGLDDLANQHVQFIGDPERRIREDVLRILRFFRFHGRFGGNDPDHAALKACTGLAHLIPQLSAERVRDELLKILVMDRVIPTLDLMTDAGLMPYCLPAPIDVLRLGDTRTIEGFPTDDAILALRLLLPDDPTIIEQAASHLRLSNKEARRLLASVPPLPPLLSKSALYLTAHRDGQGAVIDRLWGAARDLQPTQLSDCLALVATYEPRQLPVDGNDLIGLGLAPGPVIKQILQSLEDWWFVADCKADRAAVMDQARRLVAEVSG